MDRPKVPKREFKNREREFKDLINGMAETITNILEYLEDDKKATDKMLRNKKDSELTVAEVRERRRQHEQSIDDLQEEIQSLRQKVNEYIINDEQNQE